MVTTMTLASAAKQTSIGLNVKTPRDRSYGLGALCILMWLTKILRAYAAGDLAPMGAYDAQRTAGSSQNGYEPDEVSMCQSTRIAHAWANCIGTKAMPFISLRAPTSRNPMRS